MKMIVQQTSKVTHVTKILSVLVPGVELSAAQLLEITGIGKTSMSSTLTQMRQRDLVVGREVNSESSCQKMFMYSATRAASSANENESGIDYSVMKAPKQEWFSALVAS
jgi:hypothetical protein